MKIFNQLKNYDEDDLMSKILFLYFSFIHGAVGVFFIFTDVSIYNSKVVSAMTRILPPEVWGILFLITTVCYVFAAMQEGRPKYISMMVGGLIGSIIFALLTMAMFELGTTQVNTARYGVISSIDLLISTVGGVSLWKLRIWKIQKGL